MVQRTIMNGLDMAFADIPLPYGMIITFKRLTFNGGWCPSLSIGSFNSFIHVRVCVCVCVCVVP